MDRLLSVCGDARIQREAIARPGLDGAKRVTLAGWVDIVILGLTLPHPPGRIGSSKEVPYGADDG
jgi:hypothetical protein